MTTFARADFSSAPVYNYKRYNAGDNTIRCDEDPSLPVFTTSTTRGITGDLKHTSIVCERGEDKSVKIRGEIDWKNKRITVEEVSKRIPEVRQKLGGFLSQDAEWTWPSGKYTVALKPGLVWTVRRDDQELAVYTSRKINIVSKDEMATLRFFVEVPDEEKTFLILALMFFDLQYQRRPENELPSAGETIAKQSINLGNLVGGIASSANPGSCVIQ